MPIVKTFLDDQTYAELVGQRKAAGLPSVSALFLQKCDVLTDDKAAAEIVRRGLARAKNKDSSSDEFRLRDLFPRSIWEQFPIGARLRAGRLFYEKVSAAVDGIRATGKSSSNQQMYKVS
jgi:hypothetical protein